PMRVDVDVDGYMDCSLEKQYSQIKMELKGNLHELIFSVPNFDLKFPHLFISRYPNDERFESIFSDSAYRDRDVIAGSRVGGSVEGRVDMTWGGSEGTKTQVEVKGEAHNDKGDNLGVTYHRDSNGNSLTTVKGGSSSDNDSSNKDK
ncbi:MAG: hypothetical protein ACRDFB_07255, partial [Rhabdochlamydiaceae bacterium]